MSCDDKVLATAAKQCVVQVRATNCCGFHDPPLADTVFSALDLSSTTGAMRHTALAVGASTKIYKAGCNINVVKFVEDAHDVCPN